MSDRQFSPAEAAPERVSRPSAARIRVVDVDLMSVLMLHVAAGSTIRALTADASTPVNIPHRNRATRNDRKVNGL